MYELWPRQEDATTQTSGEEKQNCSPSPPTGVDVRRSPSALHRYMPSARTHDRSSLNRSSEKCLCPGGEIVYLWLGVYGVDLLRQSKKACYFVLLAGSCLAGQAILLFSCKTKLTPNNYITIIKHKLRLVWAQHLFVILGC